MQTLYQKIVTYKGDNIKHCLQLLGLLEIFEPIFEHYPKDVHEAAVMYIVNAYSKDSPLIYVGASNWTNIKENCAKQAALPKEYWENFVYLSNEEGDEQNRDSEPEYDEPDELEPLAEKEPVIDRATIIEDRIAAIIDAISDYMTFQGVREHRHLVRMYDLYEELLDASVDRIKKGSKVRDMDYETKRKCMKDATELLAEIEQFEKKMAIDDAGLQRAKEEIANKVRTKKEFRAEVWAR